MSPDRRQNSPGKMVRSATSGVLRGRDLKTGELVSPDPRAVGLSKTERVKYCDSPERNYERERAWKTSGRLSRSKAWQQTLYPASNLAQRDTWGQLRPGVVREAPAPKPKSKPKSFGKIGTQVKNANRVAGLLNDTTRTSVVENSPEPDNTCQNPEPPRELECPPTQGRASRVSVQEDKESSYSSSIDEDDDEVELVLGGYSPAGRRTCLLTFVGPSGLVESEGRWTPEKSAIRAKDENTDRGRLSCLNLYVQNLDTARSPERSREPSPNRDPGRDRRASSSRERRQSRDQRGGTDRESSRERLPRERRASSSPTTEHREGPVTTGNVYERYAEAMQQQMRTAFGPDPRS
jgi:hypothetical protein